MTTLYRPQRNWGARVHESSRAGIPATVLENHSLQLTFLHGKGSDVVEFNYKPLDLDFVWLTPGGIKNPAHVHAAYTDPLGSYQDTYPGGWQEIFPSGGIATNRNGATFGQHGEVFYLPWDVAVVEDRPERVTIQFRNAGAKTPCVIEKTVSIDEEQAKIEITERLFNDSPVPFSAMWGHHITFGQPFLQPGCKITVPDGVNVVPRATNGGGKGRRISNTEAFVWPMADGANGKPLDLSIIPERGTPSEMLFITDFPGEDAWYQVDDPDRGIGMRVSWDKETMPFLWFWQEFGAIPGYPWYGRVFVQGLEPFSTMPLRSLEEGEEYPSIMVIPPHGEVKFRMTVEIIDQR